MLKEVCGTRMKCGYILAEVLVCTVLVTSVVLLGIDASAFAVKTIEKLDETLQDSVSLSSVIAERESTRSASSIEDLENWEATVIKKDDGKVPSVDRFIVSLSADIGRSQIGLSWTQWEIKKKR
jgi:hypothetical protein